MTPPAGNKNAYVANVVATAQARGVTDPTALARVRQDAMDQYDSRLSRDPKTNAAL